MQAAARLVSDQRDSLVAEWSHRLGDRLTASSLVPRDLVERQLGLILDLIIQSVGPLRREVGPMWRKACEHHGRAASLRGLAAGEVVEEFQHLRELLTLRLAASVIALRPRQALAIMLRLHRLLDHGTASAVVGYTDALVATLFVQSGVPTADTEVDGVELERQIVTIEQELAFLARRS